MENEPKGESKAALGCAIGCGVVILAGVVCVLAVVLLLRQQLGMAREEAAASIATQYEESVEAGDVSEERLELIKALAEAVEEGDVSTPVLMTAWIAVVTLAETDANEEDEGAIIEAGERVLDYVTQRPGAGYVETFQFVENYPELEEAANRVMSGYRGPYVDYDGTVSVEIEGEGAVEDLEPGESPQDVDSESDQDAAEPSEPQEEETPTP